VHVTPFEQIAGWSLPQIGKVIHPTIETDGDMPESDRCTRPQVAIWPGRHAEFDSVCEG
jgi:hypothetical protein